MAAACTVTAAPDGSTGNTDNLNNDYLEAQIVAQAITELQEIQGPVLHIQGSDETGEGSDLVTNIQTDGVDGEATETHVIYYIDSNGSFTGALEKSFADSSVQANDYEIERRSGRVPARKRVIPNKFRDYKNTSHDENSDSDFDPNEYSKKVRRTTKPIRRKPVSVSGDSQSENPVRPVTTSANVRGVGRPRKNFLPATTVKGTSISQECFNPPPSAELEKKFQEAIRMSEQEVQTDPADKSVDTTKQTDDVKQEGTGDAESLFTHQTENQDSIVVGRRARGRPRGPHWKKFYKCPDCGKTFNQKANLRVHLRVHTKERPFPCVEEGCGKSLRSNEGLRRHLLSHQGIKPFECSVCGNKFSSNVALIEHQSRHTNEKPHPCPHCERRFRQVSCLRRHVSTHSDSLPHQCTVCQRQFAQPAYLRSHMKIHTGEKPYKCDICGKRFAHQSDLKRHKIIHTGTKPYSCGKCQAKFSDVSSKNRHEREHENNKRFTCHLCSDTFKRMGQLRSHLHRRHSHTFAVKIEKDPNNGTYSFKMGEEGDPGSVFFTQKRILSLIKNLQNKGFTEIENIALVSLPEGDEAGTQADGNQLTTDISQLEKEVDASEIEGEVRVPVELQGVEVQGDGNQHTYIAVNDYSGAWHDGEKNDADNMPVHYQKVQIITDDGENKEILIPCSAVEAGLNVQVAYSSTVDQHDNIITFNADECPTSDIAISASTSNSISISTQQDGNVVIDNGKIGGPAFVDGGEDKLVTYEVGDKDVANCETDVAMSGSNVINTHSVEGIVIEDGSIMSMAIDTDTESSQTGYSMAGSQIIVKQNNETVIEKKIVMNGNNKKQEVITESVESARNDSESVNTVIENPSVAPEGQYDNLTVAPEGQHDNPSVAPEGQHDNPSVAPEGQHDNPSVAPEGQHDNKTESPVTVDYVTYPDFGSQGYYNWLTKFTELCKVVPLPLDMSLFQKISQVHKTLSDVMANPSGVVADRENFTVLMNITKELSTIINEHLVFVLENLRPEVKPKEGSSASN